MSVWAKSNFLTEKKGWKCVSFEHFNKHKPLISEVRCIVLWSKWVMIIWNIGCNPFSVFVSDSLMSLAMRRDQKKVHEVLSSLKALKRTWVDSIAASSQPPLFCPQVSWFMVWTHFCFRKCANNTEQLARHALNEYYHGNTTMYCTYYPFPFVGL